MNAPPVPRLRLAFFGSASRFSQLVFEQLTETQEMVALVVPRTVNPGLRGAVRKIVGRRAASPLEAVAYNRAIPVISASDDFSGALGERLRNLRPDLICIAIFPRILPPDLTEIAALGAINAHPSLLPRHRGPLPLFWTYRCDDRITGVTVHHANERFDAGDVILQDRFELPRGYPVAELDREVALRAGPLLRAAVEQLRRGCAPRVPQDESRATYAPIPRPRTPMVAFDQWDVERVWHFLAALCPQYREPLADEAGHDVLYDRVIGYRRQAPRLAPGRVERCEGGWMLHCRDGVLRLGAQ
jgi:methionyl-tRNA formyltransferase